MLDIMIYLAILCIVCLVVWWLLSQMQLPEPIGQIVRIAIVVIVACVVVGVLLNLGGHGNYLWLPR